MKEAIEEIRRMIIGKSKPAEIVMMLDALSTMAERLESLESTVNSMREVNNGSQKSQSQSGFNIG